MTALPRADRGRDHADVLGCRIDRLDMAETVARCESFVESGTFAQHVAINAAKLVSMHEDRELQETIGGCELVSADGQAVVWASRLIGDPLPERVAGIDLMDELMALAARRGHRVYVLGARHEVLERALSRLCERHPDLQLAGYRDGYFSEAEEAEVAAEIQHCRPQMLFVAMPSPRKEYFLGRHGQGMGVPFAMGVGGSIDVVAGEVHRAPGVMQRLGLEWLFRLLQEPARLFPRYARTNTIFAYLVLREMIRRRRVRGRGDRDRL